MNDYERIGKVEIPAWQRKFIKGNYTTWRIELIKSFMNGERIGTFIMNFVKDGVCIIVDGHQRYRTLVNWVNTLSSDEYESIKDLQLVIEAYANASDEYMRKVFQNEAKRAPVRYSEIREAYTEKESPETAFAHIMMNHEFFKHCVITGNNTRKQDRECCDWMLSFLTYGINQCPKCLTNKALETFALTQDIPEDVKDVAIRTLDLMNSIYKELPYTLGKVDFCCIAKIIESIGHTVVFTPERSNEKLRFQHKYTQFRNKFGTGNSLGLMSKHNLLEAIPVLQEIAIEFQDFNG
jgi:hypothetical protein